MRKAFALIELLAVIAIMAMMGVAATGGYRALINGMQERGVCAAASGALRAAKEKAQVDRVRTVVYCYNKCLKVAENVDDNSVVAGVMTAIRIAGRVTRVDGDLVYDEFGDLDLSYEFSEAEEDCGEDHGHRLFQYNGGDSSGMKYSIVSDVVYRNAEDLSVDLFSGGRTNVIAGAFKVLKLKDTGVTAPTWKIGDGYAFEFLEMQLPDGYIFEGSMPTMRSGAISSVSTIVFDPDENSTKTISIYTTAPDASGTPVKNRKAGEAKADATRSV